MQEAYVERADGHLPTIPRWNAAKMPLTSGLAQGGAQAARGDLDARLARRQQTPKRSTGWSRPTKSRSRTRRPIVEVLPRAARDLGVAGRPRSCLIELYREGDHSHYFFHSLIGRSANDALSRIVAWRVQERIGGNALVTIDDYGFLLTLAAVPGVAARAMATAAFDATERKKICTRRFAARSW